MDRYRLQEWLAFLGSELHKSYGLIFNPKSSADCKAIAFDNINRRLSHINDTLTAKQYLLGDTFTVADAYAFTILSWNFARVTSRWVARRSGSRMRRTLSRL